MLILQQPFRYAGLFFGLSLASLALAIYCWPLFDTDFWFEIFTLLISLLLSLGLLAHGLFRANSWWVKATSLVPGFILVAIFFALIFIIHAKYQAGASIHVFTAKEDYSNNNSRIIDLAYMKLSATHHSAASPIIYLAGGPGWGGTTTLITSGRAPLFQAMRAIGDIIVYDQRGTMPWAGDWLVCPETWQPSNFHEAFSTMRSLKEQSENINSCANQYRQKDIHLSSYNTNNNAADLEALRRHLGVEKISLWATSYGTHLALAYIKLYPQHVEKVIMHGVEGLDDTLKTPMQIQNALENIAKLAAQDKTIGALTPNLLGDIKALLDKAESGKIALKYQNKDTTETIQLSKFELQFYLSQLLSSAHSSLSIPARIAAAKQGNLSGFRDSAIQMRNKRRESLMPYFMDCASYASSERLSLIAQQKTHALLGDAINFPFPDICSAIGAAGLGNEFRSPALSNVPVLFISGDLDSRTPIENAQQAALGFSNAQHLIIHGAGHGNELFLSSEKILQTMLEFMKNEQLSVAEIEVPIKFLPLDSFVEK
jgi:pimeloyl-ACP methyl ester carboxylesterase